MVPARNITRHATATSLILTALIASVTVPPSASQAQTLRPIYTETAKPLPSGEVQISLGTSYFRNRRFPHFTAPDFLHSQDLFTAPELEVRIGAGDWVEILLSYEFLYIDEEQRNGGRSDNYGGGDAQIFTKVRFLRECDTLPAVGARFGVKLPNADRADRLGTDETDFELAILASKDFGFASAHLNLGLQILGNPGRLNGDESESDSGQDDPFIYSLALVSQPLLGGDDVAHTLRALVSIDGKEGSRFSNDGSAARAGLQLDVDAWTLYAGASAGISGASEDLGARFGATYRFALDRFFAGE